MGLARGRGGCGRMLASGFVPLFLLITILSSPFPTPSDAAAASSDTLFKGQSVAINESLVSASGAFRLGFFHLGSFPRRYYLGIWYANISVRTVVWVGNRESPLMESSGGSLTITSNGTLAVMDASGVPSWSSNSSVDWLNTTARIDDSGAFILLAGDGPQTLLWRSFDHPTDTFIPGMQITMDSAGQGERFVSWRSPDNPAAGSFSLGLDPLRSGQIYIWNGTQVRWRSGQWNKVSFIGITRMNALSFYGFNLNPNDNGKMTLSFTSPPNNRSLLRFVVQSNGIENTSMWVPEQRQWSGIWLQPLTDCETYNFCGRYAICDNDEAPKCSCLQGFLPWSESEWAAGNWSGGCIRRTVLGCPATSTGGASSSSNGSSALAEGFFQYDKVKLPDLAVSALFASDEAGCAAACSGNCSCTAYAYVPAIGCNVWYRDLVDVAQFSTGGSTLFLKLAAGDIPEPVSSDQRNKTWILWVALPVGFLLLVLCFSLFFWWKLKDKIRGCLKSCADGEESVGRQLQSGGVAEEEFSGPGDLGEDEQNEAKASDLPMFSFNAVAAATDNFSAANKLGQGGFGLVYRGVLPDGEEVAVKRLSRSSGQGVDEFKNEVEVIAKLQHRNLVRLLGCCIQGEEKILIYEYMKNKSLDFFLFHAERQPMLDWRIRFDIIEGIARGLLYLHRDSRLRIVHRDLKASNILLDEDMNPKISDFGMARIFGGNQNIDSTNRVVGTFGYMSPEYAMEGLFSVKSDVYSFGVLVLETVSGKKNSRTRSDSYTNLLGHVWQLWTTDRAEEIIDPCIRGSCNTKQALRCVHIGLLCVQDRSLDRPTMSTVAIMLGGDSAIQQTPKQPTFASEGSPSETECSQKHDGDGFSVNDVTITILSGR